jgi:phosphate transport system substrate-binding protein
VKLRTSRLRWLPALLAAFALLAAACGDDSGSSAGGGTTGNIVISGSSTVEPISSLVAEQFSAENDVGISVDGPGTGDGFELFCNGETDISDASRPIEDEEAEVCAANDIEFTELRVGIDGLSVLTSQANDALECLDFAGIYALVGPESIGFSDWSDAADLADTVGSEYGADFPDAPLDITGPGEESGTYDTFVEFIVEDIAEEQGLAEEEFATRPDYISSPNDNVIIDGITGSDNSFGWVGYAFYIENQDNVRAFEVADPETGECVAPTAETIAAGDYPLSRDLFVYVNNGRAAENQALVDFVDFYLSDAGFEDVAEAGYVQLTDEAWAETQATWEGR